MPSIAPSSSTMSRRHLIAAPLAGLILLAVAWAAEPTGKEQKKSIGPVAFFLIGDTHVLSKKLDPSQLDERSVLYASQLVDTLNKLSGTAISKEAGGGAVLASRGVIHAGDCIDTGSQAKSMRAQTEWNAFTKLFGLTGKDGRLTLPLYEVHGNHDGPRGEGLAVEGIIARNKTRPGVVNVSKNGLHYSWDWGHVHFVNLGIVVGQVGDVTRKRRYAPQGSLEFLISDLKEKVGDSGRPVVVTHHVDMLRFSLPLPVDDKAAAAMDWDPADVKGFYNALRGYNVAAILYGHTHVRNIFRWDGSNKAAKTGIPVFNVSKASHYASKQQALFYMEINADTVVAREYKTANGWETGSWTPLSWSAPIMKVAP